ncbi:MAG: ABC transporter substrate-binding protein, partial [Dehalococcoidia bacterium]|nr:ABC transporter substrate-binding protein [Dehalococcoidia bacterium]
RNTMADLQGKSIGLEAQGTILHVLAKVALRKNGVDPDKDVNWIGIGVGAAPAVAMKAGTVDATVLTDSYALQLEAEGFPVLAALRDYVNGPSGGVAVREDMLKSKPQTVKKMVRAMLKAQAYLKSQTPDSRAYIIDFLVKGGMQKDLAAILYDREVKQFTDSGWLPDDILKADIDIVKESLESTGDKIEGSFGVDKLYDLSIVKQAADDLKKEGWKP